jgi:predicted HicB family RNase H-like nuclease
MSDEKKSTYTGQTDARRKANSKYLKEQVEALTVRVPKGQKEVIKTHATRQKESVNGFIIRAIQQTMRKDKSERDAKWTPFD